MTQWRSIRNGDKIRHIKSGQVRDVLKDVQNDCVLVKALRRTWYGSSGTVIAPSQRLEYDLVGAPKTDPDPMPKGRKKNV